MQPSKLLIGRKFPNTPAHGQNDAIDLTETLAVHCATVLKPVSSLSEYLL